MATKRSVALAQTSTPFPTPAPTADAPDALTLEAMLAQQRALHDQIKAARAALPKLSPLEKVIAQQAEHPQALITFQRVRARVRAGQAVDEAIEAVFTSDRRWIEEQLANEGLAEQA